MAGTYTKSRGETSEPADGARKDSTAQLRDAATGPLQTLAYYLAHTRKKKGGPNEDSTRPDAGKG
jgi:hypothetical protein